MADWLTLGIDDPIQDQPIQPRRPERREAPHCPCGRFARFIGGRHYYNGTFNCYSYDVDCSRCGIVTVECV